MFLCVVLMAWLLLAASLKLFELSALREFGFASVRFLVCVGWFVFSFCFPSLFKKNPNNLILKMLVSQWL